VRAAAGPVVVPVASVESPQLLVSGAQHLQHWNKPAAPHPLLLGWLLRSRGNDCCIVLAGRDAKPCGRLLCMPAAARALLPMCAAAVLRLLRDARAPHPATLGLNWDSSLRCDTHAAPEVPLVAEAIARLEAQVVQQQAQLTQMVQLLVNDRLRPRSSSTSKQQRDRCGCTNLTPGPTLDVMQVT
jgi:hypothetical protein